MNVVGHQPVGQEADCEAPDGSCQLLEVSRVVLIITKDGLVIVSTDCHVVDGSVVGNSKWAWHTKGSDPFEISNLWVAVTSRGGLGAADRGHADPASRGEQADAPPGLAIGQSDGSTPRWGAKQAHPVEQRGGGHSASEPCVGHSNAVGQPPEAALGRCTLVADDDEVAITSRLELQPVRPPGAALRHREGLGGPQIRHQCRSCGANAEARRERTGLPDNCGDDRNETNRDQNLEKGRSANPLTWGHRRPLPVRTSSDHRNGRRRNDSTRSKNNQPGAVARPGLSPCLQVTSMESAVWPQAGGQPARPTCRLPLPGCRRAQAQASRPDPASAARTAPAMPPPFRQTCRHRAPGQAWTAGTRTDTRRPTSSAPRRRSHYGRCCPYRA